MEIRGQKSVKIQGRDHKGNITGVIGCSRSGLMLPPQLIYKGSTTRCLAPSGIYPPSYDQTSTRNHWSTRASKLRYLNKVLIPWVNWMRGQLGLTPGTDYALVIMDHTGTNLCTEVAQLLIKNRILYQLVPRGMTSQVL